MLLGFNSLSALFKQQLMLCLFFHLTVVGKSKYFICVVHAVFTKTQYANSSLCWICISFSLWSSVKFTLYVLQIAQCSFKVSALVSPTLTRNICWPQCILWVNLNCRGHWWQTLNTTLKCNSLTTCEPYIKASVGFWQLLLRWWYKC